MPTFNFTTGNIANLVGGGNAAMSDIQGSFTDVRSAINGNLDEVNVPNVSAAFTTYKALPRAVALITSAAGAGTYLLSFAGAPTNITANTTGADPSLMIAYLDPTDFNANARTTKLRIRAGVVTNSVAPAITFTVGLYPVSTLGGTAPAAPFIATLGTVISGSPVAVASPLSGTGTWVTGSDFNFPAAGPYVVAVVTSGAQTANATQYVFAFLEMRQV